MNPKSNRVRHEAIDQHIGRRIREARIAAGLSQGALAEALGITFQQIQKYERGTNRASPAVLMSVSAQCNVPVTYFFDGIANTSPPPQDDHLMLQIAVAARRLEPEFRRQLLNVARTLVAAQTREAA